MASLEEPRRPNLLGGSTCSGQQALRTHADASKVVYELQMLQLLGEALCTHALSAPTQRAGSPGGDALGTSLCVASTNGRLSGADCAVFEGREPLEDKVRWNAYIEAFLVHFRCLAQFLTRDKRPRSHDEVVAFQFFDDREPWKKEAGDWRSELENWVERVDRHLAHISDERGTQLQQPAWPFWQMAKKAEEAFDAFLNRLSAAHSDRAAWFAEARRPLG